MAQRRTPQETEFINPLENPEKANADIAAALKSTLSEAPVIDFPPDDLVNLPGGLVTKDVVIKTGIVKELTGQDEEALARASQSMNPYHFLDRLLKCGVVRLGDEPPSQTEALLNRLLIGDREQLILGIRNATYGDQIEVENWRCPLCGVEATLSMELSDIPAVKMSDTEADSTFKIPLRKGGFALVRLATGEDQLAIFEKDGLSQAQRETILLSRCVISLVDKAGNERTMQGFPSMSLEMSVPDRHAVLRALSDRQPGPKYDQIKYTCEACGEESNVTVTIGDLFLDFGWI